MNIAEYEQAKADLRKASASYYTSGTSFLTDAEFDELHSQCVEFEVLNKVTIDTVGGTIGAGAALSGTVKHTVKMLSLDNLFSKDALDLWMLSIDHELTVTEPKLDGLAMSIRFRNGRPVQMLTRGDGVSGEDVTGALSLLSNLPDVLMVPTNRFTRDLTPFDGELRGEVIFSREQFAAANTARVAAGGVEFANARNAAAGTVNKASKGGDVPAGTKLSFICYGAVGMDGFLCHSEVMGRLATGGVTTALSLFDGGVEVTLNHKPDIGFDIDGLVFKVDVLSTQDELGSTSRAPRWARAYKYPPEVAQTELVDVLWQVGRTGAVTPRGVLNPVKVGGTTVTYATLNNPDDIARKGLYLGAKVEVRRAAEVIPEITGLVVDGSTGPGIDIPTLCPNCGEGLDTSQARLRCPSGGECALDRKLSYAASRDALDIEGLSDSLSAALVDAGKVKDVGDLFSLSESNIATLPTGRFTDAGSPICVGEVIAAKVKTEIERARIEATFERVLIALGLHGTGRSMSKRVAQHFGSMDAVLAADADDFEAVDKMGPIKAASLRAQLHTPQMRDAINKLRDAGLNMEIVQSAGPQPLAGQTLVVTGSMKKLGSRSEVTSNMEALGAVVGSSVGSKTTVVVADDPEGTSSKLVKARKLGVLIMDEETFISHFGLDF